MKSVITFLSQLALVSLAISFETVAAHPRHRHNERAHHHGQPQPRPVTTTTTTVPNDVPFATRGVPGPAPAPATIPNSGGNITSKPPPPTGGSGAYQLVKSYSGSSFFNNFNFFTGADPTHGFVK